MEFVPILPLLNVLKKVRTGGFGYMSIGQGVLLRPYNVDNPDDSSAWHHAIEINLDSLGFDTEDSKSIFYTNPNGDKIMFSKDLYEAIRDSYNDLDTVRKAKKIKPKDALIGYKYSIINGESIFTCKLLDLREEEPKILESKLVKVSTCTLREELELISILKKIEDLGGYKEEDILAETNIISGEVETEIMVNEKPLILVINPTFKEGISIKVRVYKTTNPLIYKIIQIVEDDNYREYYVNYALNK